MENVKREKLSALVECIINGDEAQAKLKLQQVTELYMTDEVSRRLDDQLVRVYENMSKGK